MRRRILFITFFIAIASFTFWFFSANTKVPEMTFAQAGKVGDAKKKVIVTGAVLDKEVVPDGGTLTFWMRDAAGEESKVFYDGTDKITADEITEMRTTKRQISVSGHACGERFHTSGITFH